jgi:hypothetical protein
LSWNSGRRNVILATMNKNLRHGRWYLAAVIVLAAETGWSQGAIVLQYPISARSASMGETGVADNSDPANLYYNPANAVGTASVYAQASHWDLPLFSDDIWIGGGSAGVRLESGDRMRLAADLAYGRLDYGESIATDPAGNPLGEVHTFEEYVTLTLGVGWEFSDEWELRLGTAGKRYDGHYPSALFTQPILDDGGFDAFAFDLGTTLARRFVVGEWSVTPALAVAFVNFGGEIDTPYGNDPLPTRFHFGSSVRVESSTTRILSADVPVIAIVYNVEAVDRYHGNHGDIFSWGIGGELSVAEVLFVRAGTSDIDDDATDNIDEKSGWGVGLGLPVGPMRTRFDYTKTSAYYEDKKLGIAIDWLL